MSESGDGGGQVQRLGPAARRLIERVRSDEPLRDVAAAVLEEIDRLTSAEISEVLMELGERRRRQAERGHPDSDAE